MSERAITRENATLRAARTRSTMHGTAKKPRLSVFVSNTAVSAQLIDDDTGKTLAAASSSSLKTEGTMTEKAVAVGAEIGKQAKAKKIKQVAFDRGNKQYHGRVKALADAARDNGLEF